MDNFPRFISSAVRCKTSERSKEIGKLIFHIVVCGVYYAGVMAMTMKPMTEQISKLTVWDLWIQFLFFGLSVVIDALDRMGFKFSKLISFRDRVFASLTVPVAQFVFIMYWGFLNTLRRLQGRSVNNSWLNHVSHTVIFPVVFIEMWLVKHGYPRRSEGLTVSLMFGVIYLYMVLIRGYVYQDFPYGVLGRMNAAYRMLFFTGCMLLICIFYLIGERINVFFWGVDAHKPVVEVTIVETSPVNDEDAAETASCVEMQEMTVHVFSSDSGKAYTERKMDTT